MKYIKTKDDRIIAIPNNSKLVLYDDEKLVIDTTKKGQTCVYGIVEKQADTIEELCDTYVMVDLDIKTTPTIDIFKALPLQHGFKINEDYAIYGAIWTDKGLIYVAKMNEKGEMELL